MHWFQSLDAALFHFVNSTLANSFFDWLMPVLSGNGVPWLIAVVVAVPVALFFGSTRLRLCALFMVLVVALGDPLVVGTIKNAVARPRPFVSLPDARLFGVTGKGYVAPMADGTLPATANVHSFPSAHAANWFALATIAFLFYRRSAWFMFPLATGVAFSRVYNGVHYPGDVTAGAILGAGYAIAGVVMVQSFWDFIGKKFFPLWHQRLPNLLKPQPSIFNLQPSTLDLHWLRLGYLVIFLALIGRWIYLGSGVIGLSEDEAYQWLWSKHLALSYYSKPPGIALIQWAGTSLFGDTDFGVRFFSPVFAALLSVLVLRFMARETGARAAFCLLLITFATPLLVVGSILMTVDPPLVLCWMWAVAAGWRAVQADGKTRDWLIAGLALGLGFLCKYTAMLQLVCWLIFFALQPSARSHLKKSGPWLGLLVFGLCTLPVIIWNAQHGWITVNHVAGDAGMHSAWHPTLNYFFEFTGIEAGLLNPIFFIAALWAMIAAWKRRREKPLWFFLFCMSAPVFLGHWLFSFHSRVQPNWIAAAVPPMFCLMVAVWSESKIRVKPWLAAGLLLGITASVFMHDSDLLGRLVGDKLPGDVDPSHRVRGWRETAMLSKPSAPGLTRTRSSSPIITAPPGFIRFILRPPAPPRTPMRRWSIALIPTSRSTSFLSGTATITASIATAKMPFLCCDLNLTSWNPAGLGNGCATSRSITAKSPRRDRRPTALPAEFETVTNLGVREINLRDGRIFQRVQIFGCYHLK